MSQITTDSLWCWFGAAEVMSYDSRLTAWEWLQSFCWTSNEHTVQNMPSVLLKQRQSHCLVVSTSVLTYTYVGLNLGCNISCSYLFSLLFLSSLHSGSLVKLPNHTVSRLYSNSYNKNYCSWQCCICLHQVNNNAINWPTRRICSVKVNEKDASVHWINCFFRQ